MTSLRGGEANAAIQSIATFIRFGSIMHIPSLSRRREPSKIKPLDARLGMRGHVE
jgi:hypothetical protein